jgi:pimeloyl-ACP methyl ester carboxylesterase
MLHPVDMLSKLRTIIVVAAVSVLAPGAQALAAPGQSYGALRAAGAAQVRDVYVRPPSVATPGQPLQVMIALHGMGGSGYEFGNSLADQADAHGWLVVAPTINYGDWTSPAQITLEEPALVAWLSDYVRRMPDRTGYAVQPRVLLFGHSRGAQLALRFTEFHPEQVSAVAAASAGTYTLPFSRDERTGKTLRFPFGLGDLAAVSAGQAFDTNGFNAVPVWIGVGAADINAADVPAAWDQYIGNNRLKRAQSFTRALQGSGASVALNVFANTDHTLTDEMRIAGCNALANGKGLVASSQ